MRHTQPLIPHPGASIRFAAPDDLHACHVALSGPINSLMKREQARPAVRSPQRYQFPSKLLDTSRNDPPNVSSSLARVSPDIAIGDLYDLRVEDQRTADASR